MILENMDELILYSLKGVNSRKGQNHGNIYIVRNIRRFVRKK